MNLSAIYTIWEREIIRYWREKTRIVSTIVQPLMFLAIFGTGLRQTLAGGRLGVDFLKFMYPGIIAMSVMGVAFFSTISTVWDREFGFLKEILVAPVSRTSIAIGKALGATTIASTQALILLILAPLIGVSLHLAIIPQLVCFYAYFGFCDFRDGASDRISHENAGKLRPLDAASGFSDVFSLRCVFPA